jgi:hypothetical protein
MALSSKHPTFDTRFPDWVLMRDSFLGERQIKHKGLAYLPATNLMETRGMSVGRPGLKMYEAYKLRAVYHEIVKPALEAMIGTMHRKPAEIELPSSMEDMRDSATFQGENLQTLLQRINEQQALMGRIGLMADVATGATVDKQPYIVTYSAESMFNWDTTRVSDDKGARALQFVILNESGFERTQGLTWNQVVKYRVLAMADQCEDIFPGIAALGPKYVAGHVKSEESIPTGNFQVVQMGSNELSSIPFVFVGPRDLAPEPDAPTLLSLARLALAIYRGEADYRQALFMQGQQTLVIKGATTAPSGSELNTNTPQTSKVEVGANATIDLPIGGDAKYIGASADGLQALANGIDADKRQADRLGANLLDQKGNAAESGDALQIRSSARSASLTTMAKAAAEGLQKVLRACAELKGADPSKVTVQPNLDFADVDVQALDLVNIMTAKSLGAPISKKTVHWWMTQHEFTNATFEDEMSEIDAEPPDIAVGGTPGVAGIPGAPAPKGPNASKPVLTAKKPPPKK